MLVERDTRIGAVRVRAPARGGEGAEARCAAALRALDLEPEGLPPQAILCIRALHDPLPGGVDVRPGRPRSRPLAWEAATRAALRAALARAVRPAHAVVPPSADAVLFADPAELLACAAREAIHGTLATSWCWRHLLRGASTEQVLEEWRRRPEYVPAALDLLAAQGAAAPFLQRWTASAAVHTLDLVLRAHALPGLADALVPLWRGGPHPDARPPSADPEPSFVEASRRRRAPPPAPWSGFVPGELEDGALSLEQRVLGAMAVLLHRAPAAPRGQPFAQALSAWIRAASPAAGREGAEATMRAAQRQSSPGSGATPERLHASAGRDPARAREGSLRLAPERPGTARGGPSAATHPEPEAAASACLRGARGAGEGAREDSALRATTAAGPSHAARPVGESPPAAGARPVARDEAPCPPIVHASAVDRSLEAPALDAVVDSALAGAFFLLNVALDLELYSHGVVVREELPIGVWDFIALVSRELLRGGHEGDPLWRLLEELAGRARVRAGRDVRGPAELSTERRERLLAQVRDHLHRSLAVDSPGPFLVEQPGRIVRSPAHLDVHFSLERHPIELRMARLDRNPGWIPATGVHVAFHFG